MSAMLTPTPALPAPGRTPFVLPIYPLSVAQYHSMIEHGILTENENWELIRGYLVPKMPKNPPHRVGTRKLRRALEPLVPDTWYVDSQEPVTFLRSEPEPD